ncbi:MAG: ABC transporter ATP-binding protein [Lachnospiraceae bacterium]|nr:ABC transporter ATP-binding protein [Lachnospiraceae bacterium]
MISFENVSKFVLSDISIYVPEGKTVGLIGASGAGKTTFIKLACGLLSPESGTVRTIGLQPEKERKQLGKMLGILFTDISALKMDDTVAGNFELMQKVYGINKEKFRADYKDLSERLGFAAFENQMVKNLSLGQRRRSEIGAAFVSRPKLLLLDEPTVGLDENAKQVFYELLKEREKEGVTVVFTSHDMAEVSKVCGRIALIDEGRIRYYGEEEQLRKKFAPINKILLEFSDKIPDLEDLPVVRYVVNDNRLCIEYNDNYVTAAEVINLIMQQSEVKEVKMRKPDLGDIIIQLKKKGTEKWEVL